MSRPAQLAIPARLATGDWAVLARPDAGPLGFLGKVTDGEWDRRDDALLRARLDTTRSTPLWFAAGDLRRVEPSEEADLVELALERGLVPDDRPGGRAERLRADVAAVRDRTLPFVRSPGLLDRLWAALPSDPAQRTGGLAAFFDEGRRLVFEAQARRHALVPPRRTPAQPPAAAPDAPPRVTSHEEAVVRILEALRLEELWTVRVRLLGDGPVDTSAAPSLRQLVEALPQGTILHVPFVLGLPKLEGTEAELAAKVVARLERLQLHADRVRQLLAMVDEAQLPTLLRDLGTASLPTSATRDDQVAALLAAEVTAVDLLDALPPRAVGRALRHFQLADARAPLAALRAHLTSDAPAAPPQPQAAPPSTVAWPGERRAVWRLLALVRASTLAGLCMTLGVKPGGSPTESCRALTDEVSLERLLGALPVEAALLAPRLLGRPGASLDQLVGQVRAGSHAGEQLLGPSPRLAPEVLLASLLRPMTAAQRARLVGALGSAAPPGAAGPALARQLLGEGHGLREVLGALDDAGLASAAAACGLSVRGELPAWLHALLVLTDASNEPPREGA